MLSRFHSAEKNLSKKKGDCTCANIQVDDQETPVVDIECSSHPGFCVLDANGVCTKRENAIHCADVSLKSLGETLLQRRERDSDGGKKCCGKKSSRVSCNKKIRCYKIDLNNSQDTGLIADKQCQTCGPECGPASCSSRSREFFIGWDKVRTKLFLFLMFVFVLWLSVYSALSLTSSL